jgi:hypothetical protein
VSTIRSQTEIEVGLYRAGDLSLVQCEEPDPIEGWPVFAELYAHDLRSIRLNGVLIGCMGYFMCAPTEADAFALIDRKACRGVGKQLAAAVRQRQLQWMEEIGLTRVWADCPRHDRKAQVFLRAIGYRRTEGDKPDTAFFVLDWRQNNGQVTEENR